MLTPRLQTIVGFVENADSVADIGCDHGLACKALIEQGRANKVIACDSSEPSLDKARRLMEESGLFGRVETRVGDGLSVLARGEADTVVIAGMGGLLIRDILSAQPEKTRAVKRFVLAPNRSEFELRQYLNENDIAIVDESLAKDNGKFYQVICAAPGGALPEEDEFFFHIGRKLVEKKDPLLREYLALRIAELDRILAMAAKSTEPGGLAAQVNERKERMREVERCL